MRMAALFLSTFMEKKRDLQTERSHITAQWKAIRNRRAPYYLLNQMPL